VKEVVQGVDFGRPLRYFLDLPLGGPLTEAAWPWPWVGVGVVFDLLELVAPIRFGEVLLDFHVERDPLDGLGARRSFRSYGDDNVRDMNGKALLRGCLSTSRYQAAALV
jgi:hypothetical protein